MSSLAVFSDLERRLERAGFSHDTSKNAPICRWIIQDCKVDIMPMDSAVFGMNSKCFPEVLSTAEMKNLGEGITGPVITAPLFLATKIEAFNDRGNADFFGSHDLEDIVTLIDGCEGIATQMEKVSPPIREHVSLTCTNFLLNRDFQDALPGHISAISGGAQRVDIILSRFQRIAK